MRLASSTWGPEEIEAIHRVIDSGIYTMGERVSEFEKAYADYCGTKYCIACNSGSSANLLMVAAYTLRHGAGSITVPAVSWSTSFSPLQQYGWHLRFMDVDLDTLNAPTDFAVNLLGNPNPTGFLEDNCESMGAEYEGRKTGSFGVMASHSTFFSHHIQTMEGGLVTTDDEYFYQMLLCLRSHGWTRHLPKDNVLNAKVGPYEFIYPGYNVRPIEMQAAIGIEQLKKLPKFVEQRRENAEGFKEVAKRKGWRIQKEVGKSSWFAFAILSDDIEEVKQELTAKGVEHRPIVAGNFVRSASIKHYDYEAGPLPNADYVHTNGIYIGNHHLPIDWSIL
jgi:CDP-6-deoxy-D-xylo-4-hexulose-3-dehydrase